MGVLDFITSDRFGNGLMAVGETLSALDQGRAPNMQPYLARTAQLEQQKRMGAMKDAMLKNGVLGQILAKQGYSPEHTALLTGAMEAAPGAVLPQVMGLAFPQKSGDPYARYRVAGGRVVDLAGDGGPQVVVDADRSNTIKAPTGYRYGAGGGLEYIPGGPADPAVRKQLRGDNKGIRVSTDENGNPVVEIGGSKSALGRAATNESEKSLVADRIMSSNLQRVGELVGFDAETGKISDKARRLFTYEGAARSWGTRQLDKLGIDAGPENRQVAKDRQVLMQNIDQMFNSYRQEITGAAAAVQELERLKKTFLNSDMGPDEFEAVFAETVQKLERIRTVRTDLLQRGYDTNTKSGGQALDRIIAGDASIEDYPSKGNSGSAPAPAISDISTEELLRMYEGSN